MESRECDRGEIGAAGRTDDTTAWPISPYSLLQKAMQILLLLGIYSKEYPTNRRIFGSPLP